MPRRSNRVTIEITMPPFQYRLESLLSLRRRQRDEFGRDLAQTYQALEHIDEQLSSLQVQRDATRADTALRFGHSAGNVSVDRLRQESRYDQQLTADQARLQRSRDQLEIELERRRSFLIEAEVEVKRLERLREKQAADYQHSQLKEEQAAADDLTNARHPRSRH